MRKRERKRDKKNNAVDFYFPGEFGCYRYFKTICDDKTAKNSVESNKLTNKYKESEISWKKISHLLEICIISFFLSEVIKILL